MSRRSCSPQRRERHFSERPRVAIKSRICDCDNLDCILFHRGQIRFTYLRNYDGNVYRGMKCELRDCRDPRYCGKYHGDGRNANICVRRMCTDRMCIHAHWERDEDLKYFKLKRNSVANFGAIKRLEECLAPVDRVDSISRINRVDRINPVTPTPIFNLQFNSAKQEREPAIIATKLMIKNEDVSPEELRATEIEKYQQLQTFRNMLIQREVIRQNDAPQKICELLKVKASLTDALNMLPQGEEKIQNVLQNTLVCVDNRITKLIRLSPPPGFIHRN